MDEEKWESANGMEQDQTAQNRTEEILLEEKKKDGNPESDSSHPGHPRHHSLVRELIDWVLHIAAAVIIALLIVKFVAQVTVVVGTSMMPTLQNGNRLMMDKLTIKFIEFERGDIVVVEAEEELIQSGHTAAQSPLIKRVVGLPGDRVRVEDGKVFVNDELKEESYILGGITYGDVSEVLVPEKHIYVMGDNRTPGGSIDSRILGTFEQERVIGRVVYRIFPLSELGRL
jgi:signal peptidase I